MQTIQQFVKKNPLKLTCEKTYKNSNSPDMKNMDHWKCVLVNTKTKKQLTFDFSMGYGHKGAKPNLYDILSSLAMEASALDMDFEDWCGEFGYKIYEREDERKFRKIYNSCIRIGKGLERVLGERQFEILRYETEPY